MVNLFLDCEFDGRFLFCSSIMNSMVSLWAWSWIPWSAMGVIYHCHISWIFFFSCQRDVLNFLQPSDKYCAHAGGLFNFKEDHPTRVCRRQQCLRMRTAQNWSFQIVKIVPEAQGRRRYLSASREGNHVLSTSVPCGACGRLTLQCIGFHTNCHNFLLCHPSLSSWISRLQVYDIIHDIMA